jgi:hypothetical protein
VADQPLCKNALLDTAEMEDRLSYSQGDAWTFYRRTLDTLLVTQYHTEGYSYVV